MADRMSSIQKASAHGYELLTAARNHALYSDENGRFVLGIRGQTVSITYEELKRLSAVRSESQNALAIVQDLLFDSLSPITEGEGERIIARSANYLSAFTELAEWHTTAAGSPAAEEPNSGATPAAVFLRQRYPNLRFEIYVDHSSYELRELVSGKAPINLVNSTWKAYLRDGTGAPNFNPMVAYGRLCDALDLSTGHPLIASRKFIVERILAPEHFQPTMLPLLASGNNTAFGGITTRIKDVLRESNALMSSLLAVSALLASINPMLGIILSSNQRLGGMVQLVCASIGSICALLGMVVMTLTRVVTLLDQGIAGVGVLSGGKAEVRVPEKEITDGTVFASRGHLLDDVAGQYWNRLSNNLSGQGIRRRLLRQSPVGSEVKVT